jgi:glycine dehydrogenase
VSAAAHGSAGILQISWAYLRMMGPDGRRRVGVRAPKVAVFERLRRVLDDINVLLAGRPRMSPVRGTRP